MIVSNEPGYYKTGAYGIRIENLVAVTESPKAEGEERDMLAFETLTLAPIDRRLVERARLSAEEAAWLDAYHARVREALGPQLDDRKSVGEGKSVSVRVDPGGRRIITKKKKKK